MRNRNSVFSGKSLEERLFQLILLLSIGIAVFWVMYRIFYFKNARLLLIHGTSLITLTIMYVVYKRSQQFEVISLVYYFALMIFQALLYFPSGGIQGATILFAIVAYCTGLLVLPPRFFVFFSLLYLLLIVSLGMLEYILPELVNRGIEEGQRMILGRVLTNVALFGALGYCLYFFKNEYMNEAQHKFIEKERLSREKEKLENAERYKERLLNTVWQEMNAPLSGIDHVLEKLEGADLPPDQRVQMSRLSKNNELLRSILSDVMEVSRIGLGMTSLRRMEFDLVTEINELIEILESGKDSNRSIYSFQRGNSLPHSLIGDPIRLKQAISSLINSATQNLRGTQIFLNTEVLFRTDKKCTIRFELLCKGAGLSKRDKALLFDKFYNTDKHDDITSEIGLDLLMPKNLIETMSGTVSFSFDKENNFIFIFDIPFAIGSNKLPGSALE